MKFLKWILGITAVLIIVLVVGYFVGPQVETPALSKDLPAVPSDLAALEAYVSDKEKQVEGLKPDNEARIIWADSIPKKTPYSILYLHGFSASQAEGAPLHAEVSKRYGCNLYLARLQAHGIAKDEAMLELTADKLNDSAKEAISIAMQLGEKVIIMATSTGGTLALYLAEKQDNIAGFVLYSPNIDIFDPMSKLLSKPWGLEIARSVKGNNYHEWPLDEIKSQYWTNKYRLEALTQLRVMVDKTMTDETFASVQQPLFVGYYYESDSAQDSTVSVPAILDMFDKIGTPDGQKRKVAFPNSRHHVMASYLTSKDIDNVRKETFDFLEEVIGLSPVEQKEPAMVEDELVEVD